MSLMYTKDYDNFFAQGTQVKYNNKINKYEMFIERMTKKREAERKTSTRCKENSNNSY